MSLKRHFRTLGQARDPSPGMPPHGSHCARRSCAFCAVEQFGYRAAEAEGYAWERAARYLDMRPRPK